MGPGFGDKKARREGAAIIIEAVNDVQKEFLGESWGSGEKRHDNGRNLCEWPLL